MIFTVRVRISSGVACVTFGLCEFGIKLWMLSDQ